jgi:hypothetical protein
VPIQSAIDRGRIFISPGFAVELGAGILAAWPRARTKEVARKALL